MNYPSPMDRWLQTPDLTDVWAQHKPNPPRRAASISQGELVGLASHGTAKKQLTKPNPPRHAAPISPDEPVGLALLGTEMKDFPKPVPLRLKERFYDIRVLYSQSLCDFISRGKGDSGNISMKLKYLGLDSQNTELHIVIQCEKRVAKRVKKFFAQKHVEEDLLPDFRVFVLDKPPIEVANDDTIDVLIDSLPLKTMCGMPVTLSGGGKSVRCTLGGVIIVETDRKRLYGLVAGHPLKKIRVGVSGKQPTYEAYRSSASASEDEEEDSDDASTTLSKPAHSDIERTNDDSILQTKLHLGSVTYDSFSFPSDENCDWALIELNQESALLNVVIRNEQPTDTNSKYYEEEIYRYSGNPLSKTLTAQVLVLKQDKPSIAELSFNTSPLMISPGSRFISAHDVKMKDGSSLGSGDSGLWVVDANTSRLYGHVVSVDAFGEAQVMPIQSTLKSIKSQLKASRAFLATALAVNKLKADLKESRSSIVPGPTALVSNLNLGSIARSEEYPIQNKVLPGLNPTLPYQGPSNEKRSGNIGAYGNDIQDHHGLHLRGPDMPSLMEQTQDLSFHEHSFPSQSIWSHSNDPLPDIFIATDTQQGLLEKDLEEMYGETIGRGHDLSETLPHPAQPYIHSRTGDSIRERKKH